MNSKRDRTPDFSCNVATQKQADAFEDMALARLKEVGHRITMPRVQVIRVLGESNRALSAQAIYERILSSGGRIDVVSVYRILATLQEIHAVHHIGLVDGYYACRSQGEHPDGVQHWVCDECGCVSEQDLSPKTRQETSDLAAKIEFAVQTVKLEVLGRCAHCVSP